MSMVHGPSEDTMARRPRARGVNGLRLNVVRGPHKSDKRVWYWRIIDNRGGRVTLWSGWATEAEAEAELARLAAPGATRPDRDAADLGITTVEHLLRAWLGYIEDARPDLSQLTVIAYRTSARRLARQLGLVRIDRLDLPTLDRWAASALRQLAPSSVSLDQTILRAVWTWGRGRGLCPDRDLPAVDIRVPRKERRTPTPGEVARVIEHARPAWVAMLLRIQWATGARLGEVASLTWDRVDWARDELQLTGKTGPRIVPMAPQLQAHLQEWRTRTPPDAAEVLGVTLITARHRASHALRAACDRAGVPRFTTHAIRRAVVDRLARSGVDVATAAALLGHSPQVMLEAYRQVSAEDRRAAVARAALGELPAGQVIEADFGGREGGG